jgi:hypothetical protein
MRLDVTRCGGGWRQVMQVPQVERVVNEGGKGRVPRGE